MYRCRQLVSQCSTTIKSNLGHGRQRFVGESTTKRFGSDHGYNPPAIKPATLNEMPTPKGSWASEHSKVQAKYNMHLAAGLGFTAFTVFVGYQTGSFYLNLGPELNTKVNVLSHEQVRKQAAEAAAAAATIVEEPVPEPEVVEEVVPVAVVEEAAPVAIVEEVVAVVEEAAPVAEVASVIVEEVAPASVPESVEAVPAPSGNESGPSDQSEGEVQSDPTVSVALTVEVVAETVSDGSSPVTESQS